MSQTAAPAHQVSHTTSTMRLAITARAMERAETLEQLVAIKDKAKALGLLERDLVQLRQVFTDAKTRFR